MKFTLEELYQMLTEENPQLQIEILEDGNMRVVAPSTFLDNAEMMERLQLQVMKVTSMAAQMGMFFPSEITAMLENYTEENEETNNGK
jgi:hypothetical protein